MNEDQSPAIQESPKKRKRSLWWLWLLLVLAVFAGGTVLGLKLSTMPLPYDVAGRLFPTGAVEAPVQAAVTPQPTQAAATPAPKVTPAPAATPMASPAPVETPDKAAVTPPAETAAGGETAAMTGKFIGVDAALKAALDRAKLKESEVEVTGVIRTRDADGQTVYEVSFNAGAVEYETIVNALNGEIEGWRMSNLTHSEVAAFAVPTPGATPAAFGQGQGYGSPSVSVEQAKEIAFAHAGVKAEDATRVRTELERRGNSACYEIDFRVGLYEYEYTIDAFTGEILAYDKGI